MAASEAALSRPVHLGSAKAGYPRYSRSGRKKRTGRCPRDSFGHGGFHHPGAGLPCPVARVVEKDQARSGADAGDRAHLRRMILAEDETAVPGFRCPGKGQNGHLPRVLAVMDFQRKILLSTAPTEAGWCILLSAGRSKWKFRLNNFVSSWPRDNILGRTYL